MRYSIPSLLLIILCLLKLPTAWSMTSAAVPESILAHEEAEFLRNILHLQRFQALCRQPAGAPAIRVLIYGQSITGQSWSTQLMESVQARFPHRQWVIWNRCIGGHAAEFLEHTAEADVYPFQPDLILFHAYGDQAAYRRLIQTMRARTVADILLIGNHYAFWDNLDDPDPGAWDGEELPALARETGTCFVDIHRPWRQYLVDRALPISSLVYDGVHPNADGQALFQQLVGRYFDPAPAFPLPDPYRDGRFQTLSIPHADPTSTNQAPYRVRIHGNRILARTTGNAGAAILHINGLPPSRNPGGAVHGRASSWPGGWWPCLLQIRSQTVPIDEQWVLRILSVTDNRSFEFEVEGSVTGIDGVGQTTEPFVSDSGRVEIQPGDWYWDRLQGPLFPSMEFRWRTSSTGSDRVVSVNSIPRWIEIAGMLPLDWHELTIDQDPSQPVLSEILVQNPSARDVGTSGTVHRLVGDSGYWLFSREPIEQSVDLKTWTPAQSEYVFGRDVLWIRTRPDESHPNHQFHRSKRVDGSDE